MDYLEFETRYCPTLPRRQKAKPYVELHTNSLTDKSFLLSQSLFLYLHQRQMVIHFIQSHEYKEPETRIISIVSVRPAWTDWSYFIFQNNLSFHDVYNWSVW